MSERIRRDLRALCAEVHEDDGMDPRHAASRRQPFESGKENRKTLQLCKQVARALALSLVDECMDPCLHAIQIATVVPAPDSAHLAVLIRLEAGEDARSQEEILARLREAVGFFRGQVARAITRKHVPELTFRWALEPEDVR